MAIRSPRKWNEYLVCFLPIGAALVFLFYLSLSGSYRKLELSDTGKAPGDLQPVISSLASFRNTALTNATVAKPNEPLWNHQQANSELNKIDSIIGTGDSVAWSSASALTLMALLAGTLFAGYVIWSSPREMSFQKRGIVTGLILLGIFGLLPLVDSKTQFLAESTVMIRQFVAVIQSHFVSKRFSVENTQWFFLAAGYGVTIALIVATAFILNPLAELRGTSKLSDKQGIETLENASRYTTMQMKHLRIILYIGAVLLVIITFQQNVTLRWALAYLQPPPSAKDVSGFAFHSFLFQRLEILVTNIVSSVGIMNSVLLAALYVPVAWVLHRRALRLSWLAIHGAKRSREAGKETSPTKEQTEWMERQGLTFPLKDQLPKIAAILSPLLAGPLGQLLNSFK